MPLCVHQNVILYNYAVICNLDVDLFTNINILVLVLQCYPRRCFLPLIRTFLSKFGDSILLEHS